LAKMQAFAVEYPWAFPTVSSDQLLSEWSSICFGFLAHLLQKL